MDKVRGGWQVSTFAYHNACKIIIYIMETTENKEEKKNRRAAFTERLQGKYPEQSFDDDEALFGRINDDYDAYDARIKGYEDNEKRLLDMFNSDPRSAQLFMHMSRGESILAPLIRLFGTDIKEAIDDPAKLDEIEALQKEYLERVAEEKVLQEQYDDNITASLEALGSLQQEMGLNDDEVNAAMERLSQMANEFIVGKITPETLRLMFNAIHHDADVAAAAEEGEVRGRNAKIEEKLRKRKQGDGSAQLAGGAGVTERKSVPRPDLGALDRFGESDDIWSRGKE